MPTPSFAAALASVALVACAGSSAHRSPPAKPSVFSHADAYERFMGRWSRLLAPEFVKFFGIRDGDAALDIGSGTGVLSFAVRDATTTGRILGVDPSADYVRFASRSNTDPRVEFSVGDAQALALPDATFDRVVSLLVVNHIPDPARAVREMKRVTKRGGVVAAAVWDYGEGMEMLRVFWDEAIALDPSIASRDEAHMPACKRGELAALWRQQGLADVEETALEVTLHFASFADYWQPFLLGQGPAGDYVVSLPDDRRTALEQRLRARLLGSSPDRAFDLHARAWAVKGIVR